MLLAEAGQAGARARGVRALGCCAGRGEKSGPRWAVREGKKGRWPGPCGGLGWAGFGLKGWFLGFGVWASPFLFPLFF